jgi:hypothetical protein
LIYVAALLFVLVGIGLIAARTRLAGMQSMFAGGRMAPGCVVAQGVAFLVLALLVILFRDALL